MNIMGVAGPDRQKWKGVKREKNPVEIHWGRIIIERRYCSLHTVLIGYRI
jgi:hypothetical protein